MARRKRITRKEAVREVAVALSDLNTFYVVIGVMEGHLHANSYAAGERIIRLCKAESQRRLNDYDRYMAIALSPEAP